MTIVYCGVHLDPWGVHILGLPRERRTESQVCRAARHAIRNVIATLSLSWRQQSDSQPFLDSHRPASFLQQSNIFATRRMRFHHLHTPGKLRVALGGRFSWAYNLRFVVLVRLSTERVTRLPAPNLFRRRVPRKRGGNERVL